MYFLKPALSLWGAGNARAGGQGAKHTQWGNLTQAAAYSGWWVPRKGPKSKPLTKAHERRKVRIHGTIAMLATHLNGDAFPSGMHWKGGR